MEIHVEDWNECPFRLEIAPEKRHIEAYNTYINTPEFGQKYSRGQCKLLGKETRLLCPKTLITRKAERLVGAAPTECPLRKGPITVKTSENSRLFWTWK